MKIGKHFIILFVFVCISGITIAQTFPTVTTPGWYDNMEKYWWYRYRLVNDFMKIGPGCGESIPAIARVYHESWAATSGDSKGNGMDWGDDATIHLGHYIGTLATEYRLLKDNGWDTWRTEQELYYALMAFKRLDQSAESYDVDIDGNAMCHPDDWGAPFGSLWNNNTPGPLNGYFLRDDVWYDNTVIVDDRTQDFVSTNLEHFNRPAAYYHAANPIGVYPYLVYGTHPSTAWPDNMMKRVSKCSAWDRTPLTSWPSGTPRYMEEESQDQATDMFLGLSLASGLLDYGVDYSGIELKYEAATAAKRIVSWFPKLFATPNPVANADDIIPEIITGFAPYNWSIKNPLTLRCVGSPGSYGSIGYCLAGAFGPCTYAWSASRAAQKASGDHFSSLLPECVALNAKSTWPNYYTLFQAMQLVPLTYATKDMGFPAAYTAVSGVWEIGVPTFAINTSWKTIRNRSMEEHFALPDLPLIYRINFSKPGIGVSPEPYLNLLNDAPKCGPYHYHQTGETHYADPEWSGPNRLSEWYKRDSYPEYPTAYNNADNCEYNGLDYMSLFNLYSYKKGDYLQYLINPYYTKDYSTNYPDGAYGTFSRRLTLNWLEYLSFRNTVNSDGFVRFRGAHELEALPGFEAKPGCVFEAFIQDYTCMGEEGDYHFAQEDVRNEDAVEHNYIEYSPKPEKFSAKLLSVNDSLSAIEDSLADVPLPEDAVQALKDSINYYFGSIDDPEAVAYLRAIGLIDSGGIAHKGKPSQITSKTEFHDKVELFPNPCKERTNIVFELSQPNNVNISITNTLGQEYNDVVEWFDHSFQPGKYGIALKTDKLASGIYYVKVTIGTSIYVRKLTVL